MTALAVFLALAAPRADALTLTANGASTYTIVLSDHASAPEQTAGQELQAQLELVTGVKLPVRAESQVEDGAPQILVGGSDRMKRLAPDVDLDEMPADAIVVRTVGPQLVLVGGRPRGTLYAVYTFLEDVVGCRWWTSTESTIPEKPTLRIPELNTAYTPPLISREAFYRDAFSCPFAARLKLNGHFARTPAEFGGSMKIIGWCHTFFSILPPDTYFAEHPDWYSEVKGKRTAEHTQLCLANAAMRDEFVRNALGRLRAEADPRIISVSQNDWGGRCQCAECAGVEEEEGSAAGPLVRFVNAVAEELEKEFPKVLVETLAYHYTRHAPKYARPRRNVLIRLCSIECDFSKPLGSSESNRAFREDMEAWSAISPQLYVWNYVTNFSNFLLPHPNLRSLAEDIRFFVEHKTLGLFEQGDAYSTTGDFVRLRAWVLAHLMWDPSRDQEALVREFMHGYYGPAAPYLLQVLRLFDDAVSRSGAYLRCYMGDTSAWLTQETLAAATVAFVQAQQAVAADPELARRVERARLTLDHVWLKRYHSLAREVKRTRMTFSGPPDGAEACRRWIEQQSAFGNRFYGEGRALDAYTQGLVRQFRPPAPAPAICKELPEGDWIDVQDNLFRLHQPGRWVDCVEDAAASDGYAARMPSNHKQWAVQYPVPEDVAGGGAWRCRVYARCEAKAATGQGMQIGLYDNETRRTIGRHDATIEEASAGDYTWFDLGVHQLTPHMYFWVAPCENADEVAAVYVDRILLVREGE